LVPYWKKHPIAFLHFCLVTNKVDIILARIKKERERNELTYADMLSDVSVKHPNAYYKIEKNKNLSVLRLLEISKALNVDVKTWFDDLEDKKQIVKEDQEKYGKASSKDIDDVYSLIQELKREILLLKKEIASIKPVPTTKKRGSTS